MLNFEIIKFACDLIKSNSGSFYFVGGSVRDFLLYQDQNKNPTENKTTKIVSAKANTQFVIHQNKDQNHTDAKNTPNTNLNLYTFLEFLLQSKKDIDIATNIHPEKIYSVFSQNGFFIKQTLVTNIAVKKNTKLEITTLRKDINPNGRWTQTQFANSIQEDSLRRDFTINAIYLEPDFKNMSYKIHDFHNGIEHIKTKTVKFIGLAHQRIMEDYLRVLRFFRFSCKFSDGFDIESLQACIDLKNNYKQACLSNNSQPLVSKERIKDEIFKILEDKNYDRFLNCVFKNNLSDVFFNVDGDIFFQKITLIQIATEVVNNYNLSKKIPNWKLPPIFIFTLIAGFDQNIIILSKRDERLINIITSKHEINKIFVNTSNQNIVSRLNYLYDVHNKNGSSNLSRYDFFNCLISYFINNFQNLSQISFLQNLLDQNLDKNKHNPTIQNLKFDKFNNLVYNFVNIFNCN
jgi:tRNA nucleotidyltransferase/poly(A) polymerase